MTIHLSILLSLRLLEKKDKYKVDPMDVKMEPDDLSEKDVGFISLFVPFVRNYATSLAKTRSPAKLPYPVCFYHPRSSLQHQMDLQMKHVDLLIEANMQPHPLGRFLHVLRYSLATCDLLKFPYKPIIAQLGETAHYYSHYSGSSDPADTPTVFVGEQLVKDPPAGNFYMHNPKYGITHTGQVVLNPKFKQAHVRVHFEAEHKTTLVHPQGLYREEYFSQIPDLIVRLLRMHTELVGEVTVTCPTTGYTARLSFKEKPLFAKTKNQLTGKISWNGNDLYVLDGIWDEVLYMTDLGTGQRMELLNRATLPKSKIESPPLSELPETSGERIWGELLETLLQQDFNKATEIKAQITKEEVERLQESVRSGIPFQPRYFHLNAKGGWELKDPSLFMRGTAHKLVE